MQDTQQQNSATASEQAANRLTGLPTLLSVWHEERQKLWSKGSWTTGKGIKKPQWEILDFLTNKVCEDEEYEVMFFLKQVKQVRFISER